MADKTFTMSFTPKQLPYLEDALHFYYDSIGDSAEKIVAQQTMVLTAESSQLIKQALKQYRLHIFNSSDEPLGDETYDLAMIDTLVLRVEAAERGEEM